MIQEPGGNYNELKTKLNNNNFAPITQQAAYINPPEYSGPKQNNTTTTNSNKIFLNLGDIQEPFTTPNANAQYLNSLNTPIMEAQDSTSAVADMIMKMSSNAAQNIIGIGTALITPDVNASVKKELTNISEQWDNGSEEQKYLLAHKYKQTQRKLKKAYEISLADRGMTGSLQLFEAAMMAPLALINDVIEGAKVYSKNETDVKKAKAERDAYIASAPGVVLLSSLMLMNSGYAKTKSKPYFDYNKKLKELIPINDTIQGDPSGLVDINKVIETKAKEEAAKYYSESIDALSKKEAAEKIDINNIDENGSIEIDNTKFNNFIPNLKLNELKENINKVIGQVKIATEDLFLPTITKKDFSVIKNWTQELFSNTVDKLNKAKLEFPDKLEELAVKLNNKELVKQIDILDKIDTITEKGKNFAKTTLNKIRLHLNSLSALIELKKLDIDKANLKKKNDIIQTNDKLSKIYENKGLITENKKPIYDIKEKPNDSISDTIIEYAPNKQTSSKPPAPMPPEAGKSLGQALETIKQPLPEARQVAMPPKTQGLPQVEALKAAPVIKTNTEPGPAKPKISKSKREKNVKTITKKLVTEHPDKFREVLDKAIKNPTEQTKSASQAELEDHIIDTISVNDALLEVGRKEMADIVINHSKESLKNLTTNEKASLANSIIRLGEENKLLQKDLAVHQTKIKSGKIKADDPNAVEKLNDIKEEISINTKSINHIKSILSEAKQVEVKKETVIKPKEKPETKPEILTTEELIKAQAEEIAVYKSSWDKLQNNELLYKSKNMKDIDIYKEITNAIEYANLHPELFKAKKTNDILKKYVDDKGKTIKIVYKTINTKEFKTMKQLILDINTGKTTLSTPDFKQKLMDMRFDPIPGRSLELEAGRYKETYQEAPRVDDLKTIMAEGEEGYYITLKDTRLEGIPRSEMESANTKIEWEKQYAGDKTLSTEEWIAKELRNEQIERTNRKGIKSEEGEKESFENEPELPDIPAEELAALLAPIVRRTGSIPKEVMLDYNGKTETIRVSDYGIDHYQTTHPGPRVATINFGGELFHVYNKYFEKALLDYKGKKFNPKIVEEGDKLDFNNVLTNDHIKEIAKATATERAYAKEPEATQKLIFENNDAATIKEVKTNQADWIARESTRLEKVLTKSLKENTAPREVQKLDYRQPQYEFKNIIKDGNKVKLPIGNDRFVYGEVSKATASFNTNKNYYDSNGRIKVNDWMKDFRKANEHGILSESYFKTVETNIHASNGSIKFFDPYSVMEINIGNHTVKIPKTMLSIDAYKWHPAKIGPEAMTIKFGEGQQALVPKVEPAIIKNEPIRKFHKLGISLEDGVKYDAITAEGKEIIVSREKGNISITDKVTGNIEPISFNDYKLKIYENDIMPRLKNGDQVMTDEGIPARVIQEVWRKEDSPDVPRRLKLRNEAGEEFTSDTSHVELRANPKADNAYPVIPKANLVNKAPEPPIIKKTYKVQPEDISGIRPNMLNKVLSEKKAEGPVIETKKTQSLGSAGNRGMLIYGEYMTVPVILENIRNAYLDTAAWVDNLIPKNLADIIDPIAIKQKADSFFSNLLTTANDIFLKTESSPLKLIYDALRDRDSVIEFKINERVNMINKLLGKEKEGPWKAFIKNFEAGVYAHMRKNPEGIRSIARNTNEKMAEYTYEIGELIGGKNLKEHYITHLVTWKTRQAKHVEALSNTLDEAFKKEIKEPGYKENPFQKTRGEETGDIIYSPEAFNVAAHAASRTKEINFLIKSNEGIREALKNDKTILERDKNYTLEILDKKIDYLKQSKDMTDTLLLNAINSRKGVLKFYIDWLGKFNLGKYKLKNPRIIKKNGKLFIDSDVFNELKSAYEHKILTPEEYIGSNPASYVMDLYRKTYTYAALGWHIPRALQQLTQGLLALSVPEPGIKMFKAAWDGIRESFKAKSFKKRSELAEANLFDSIEDQLMFEKYMGTREQSFLEHFMSSGIGPMAPMVLMDKVQRIFTYETMKSTLKQEGVKENVNKLAADAAKEINLKYSKGDTEGALESSKGKLLLPFSSYPMKMLKIFYNMVFKEQNNPGLKNFFDAIKEGKLSDEVGIKKHISNMNNNQKAILLKYLFYSAIFTGLLTITFGPGVARKNDPIHALDYNPIYGKYSSLMMPLSFVHDMFPHPGNRGNVAYPDRAFMHLFKTLVPGSSAITGVVKKVSHEEKEREKSDTHTPAGYEVGYAGIS